MKAVCIALLLAACAVSADQIADNKKRRDERLAGKRKQWDELFPKIDTNNDNKLSPAEVTAYMQSGHHLLTKAGKAEAIKEIKESIKKEFASLDKDGDGLLDSSEMKDSDEKTKRNLRRRGGDAKKKIDLDAYLLYKNPHLGDDEKTYIYYLALDLNEVWDKSGDGKLQFEEYDAMKGKERDNLHKFTKEENDEGMVTISFGGPSDDESKVRKDKDDADFKKHDADNSGDLDMKELEKSLNDSAEAKWASEVDEFFTFSDQDKDGFLEKNEVHHNADFFAVNRVLAHREALHSEL
jgi:hypothetical protein